MNSRAVARIGSPVLLTAMLLAAMVALGEGLQPASSSGWLVPVLIVQGVGVLVNLGIISWARWSVERIADIASRRAVEAHNDRGDAHLLAAPGKRNVREALTALEHDVESLRHDVDVVQRAALGARDPLDSPHPRRETDDSREDFRLQRGRRP